MFRGSAVLSVVLVAWVCTSVIAEPTTRLGIDVLAEADFEPIRGKRVGLVAHPASVAGDLTHSVDVLKRGADAGQFTLVALFGPEHGVYGDVYAGGEIDDAFDLRSGLPVRSLYGETRKPTPEMLADLDTLVFDLQDIGSRSYTFISTMRLCLEACIENNKALVVLDRPNPLGGKRIEGPAEVEDRYRSFISQIDVPYVHGMTMGELALLERDRIDKDFNKLTVVAMQGWRRDMSWTETGLVWVPTSPHIPTPGAAAGYAATGVLGELGVVSNGVGYTLPFEIVGAPDVDADALVDDLRGRALEGIHLRAARFKPFFATHQGEVCGGVQVHLDHDAASNYYELNFVLIDALGLRDRLRTGNRLAMFDKANGTDATREWLAAGKPIDKLFAKWRRDSAAFARQRDPYLLYD
ncbi:MAG: DUF1343 domain-containing protein [Planctomycetota bacterium]